jgi:hypothetical protein
LSDLGGQILPKILNDLKEQLPLLHYIYLRQCFFIGFDIKELFLQDSVFNYTMGYLMENINIVFKCDVSFRAFLTLQSDEGVKHSTWI